MGTATLLLDASRWDMVVDAAGDIAVATSPYALAQDAASAIRTFQGELWFDVKIGVPYFPDVLGESPPPALLKALFVNAALTVPGVASAKCFITGAQDRIVSGQVQVTPKAGGAAGAAAF